jgi:hypothetical protein
MGEIDLNDLRKFLEQHEDKELLGYGREHRSSPRLAFYVHGAYNDFYARMDRALYAVWASPECQVGLCHAMECRNQHWTREQSRVWYDSLSEDDLRNPEELARKLVRFNDTLYPDPTPAVRSVAG